VGLFAGRLGDGFRRGRIMVAADLVGVCTMSGAAAAVFAGAPAEVVYALAVVTALSGTAFPPAQAALLPSLARTPEELTAANATTTSIESVAFFAGPAPGGVLLAFAGVGRGLPSTAARFRL